MKNITLSAPEELIDSARKLVVAKGTTLNSEFRNWLKSQSISGQERAAQHQNLLKRLSYVNAGRKFYARGK